jgi:hypothetical protein
MPTFKDWNLLDCTDCRLDVSEIALNSSASQTCQHCDRTVSVYVFPAMARDMKGAISQDQPVIASESSCFYHPQKTAAVICDTCGRFLCGLCDVDTHGGHLCTACLEIAAADEENPTTPVRYVHYDSIALLVVVVGILFWFISFITAFVSLYFVVRYWRKPLSVLPRNRWRFVVAALLSLATLGMWGTLVVTLIAGIME